MLKEKYTEVLEQAYKEGVNFLDGQIENNFDQIIVENINTLVKNIDKNKSLFCALITSLTKKIIDPEQDIRLHRTDFEGGYSGRTLDEQVTAPFFKLRFPKYANKESSFLTLSTRERIKWTLEEGNSIKARNKKVKKSFLLLFDAVEKKLIDPYQCLVFSMTELLRLSMHQSHIYDSTIDSTDFSDVLNINTVIRMLEVHFEEKLSSRLPVIAIYTIYQELFDTIKRYAGKILTPLNVHTSADKHGYGDVEVWNEDGSPFEMVEIKHNRPIERNMIFDIAKKTEGTAIEKYYILTTNKNNFLSDSEEEYINRFILKIKKVRDLEIIANGIIYSLKYYLRFIPDYKEFLKRYTENLILDSKNSTEVREFHIQKWQDILNKHNNL